MKHWGVSLWAPREKSMGCRKTEHGVGLVEGRGTLRRTLGQPQWVLGLLKGGSLTPLNGQNGQNDQFQCFFEKSLKIPARNQSYGLGGLSGHQRGGQGQRCHGVAHERHQNAQNWTAPWAPPTTHKNKEIKMKKNEKDPIFWLETHTVTFQLSNRARKKMLWGGGVTHGGAQM